MLTIFAILADFVADLAIEAYDGKGGWEDSGKGGWDPAAEGKAGW